MSHLLILVLKNLLLIHPRRGFEHGPQNLKQFIYSYSLDHLEVFVLYPRHAEVFTLYQQYSALFLLFLTFIYFV